MVEVLQTPIGGVWLLATLLIGVAAEAIYLAKLLFWVIANIQKDAMREEE